MATTRKRKESKIAKNRESVRQIEEEISLVFTEEQIIEYRNIFILFDEFKHGFISANEIPMIFSRINHVYDINELNDVISEIDKANTGDIDIHKFLLIAARTYSESISIKEIKDAFKVFDTTKSTIKPQDLRYYMTQFGEPFTKNELKVMMHMAEDVENSDDEIDYNLLVDKFTYKTLEKHHKHEIIKRMSKEKEVEDDLFIDDYKSKYQTSSSFEHLLKTMGIIGLEKRLTVLHDEIRGEEEADEEEEEEEEEEEVDDEVGSTRDSSISEYKTRDSSISEDRTRDSSISEDSTRDSSISEDRTTGTTVSVTFSDVNFVRNSDE